MQEDAIMKKNTALALVALASLLCACNPPWATAATDTGTAIDELCLQENFAPCRPEAPSDLAD
jgi:hypothetical protein